MTLLTSLKTKPSNLPRRRCCRRFPAIRSTRPTSASWRTKRTLIFLRSVLVNTRDLAAQLQRIECRWISHDNQVMKVLTVLGTVALPALVVYGCQPRDMGLAVALLPATLFLPLGLERFQCHFTQLLLQFSDLLGVGTEPVEKFLLTLDAGANDIRGGLGAAA